MSNTGPTLGQSSGFQSYQYRELEFLLGNKSGEVLGVHETTPAVHAHLLAVQAAPSLYDECIRLLDRRGFTLGPERSFVLPHIADPQVEAAWLAVYREPERYWDLYELAEKLVDLEFRWLARIGLVDTHAIPVAKNS